MEIRTNRYAAYTALGLSRLIGGGSLVLFMVFLLIGPLNLVDMGLDETGILWLDAGLSLLFFIQHSGMVRRPFKQWLTRFIAEEYGRAVYTIASGLVLSAVILLWQESPRTFVGHGGIPRWPFRVLFILSIAGFFWTVRALLFFDPFGLRPIIHRLRGTIPRPTPFTVRGSYRWVRHPLYLFAILMIWASPDLTGDRLLFNALWTAWIVIGSFLEERDLIAEFGDTYREYQQRVPMFIPRLVGGFFIPSS